MEEQSPIEKEKQPSIHEVRKFYKEQIEISGLAAQLAQNKRNAAVYRFEELEAIVKRAQLQNALQEKPQVNNPDQQPDPAAEG